jgi:hypothetical protein
MAVFNARQFKRAFYSLEAFGLFALLSILVAGSAGFAMHLLDPVLVLPTLSLLLLSYAALAAIPVHMIPADSNPKTVTPWDVAGAFVLTGCAATIFSEPDQVAQFFEKLADELSEAPS